MINAWSSVRSEMYKTRPLRTFGPGNLKVTEAQHLHFLILLLPRLAREVEGGVGWAVRLLAVDSFP